ncbi:acyl-CoA dehydrogenase family protein [Streptomyces beigongshangae]|uniref:acyl-CoA dehydrogenase family protein n=1 Tax=Streptomyces beigongshangae TaxID=2841597 RepID=UPI001C857FA9|nr:acyl-CoA dehydrogenase family protein [Streptomyces sp. REN17]
MAEADGALFAGSVRPHAASWDRAGELPSGIVRDLARAGLLACDLPTRYGGSASPPLVLGRLCAELGGVCSALRSLVTVQGMVAASVLRWGTEGQRARWLPALAGGDLLAGFAATEDGAGTELSAVASTVRRDAAGLVLDGRKRWVTFGGRAGVLLVLARLDGHPTTVLVEADRPGVTTEPVHGLLGLRAAHVAHVGFDAVRVPEENLLAPPGFGLSHVAATALDHGRYTVAWGCAGMAAACVDHASAHAAGRRQGEVLLSDHQVVRARLGRAVVATAAARELCARAAASRQDGGPEALLDTVIAKYAAARAAATVSQDALQLMGAVGCTADSPVERFFRDARITQLIEGAEQVAEVRIGEHALRGHAGRPTGERAVDDRAAAADGPGR